MTMSIYVVCGIAAGFLFFNCFLAVTWCLLRRRRQEAKCQNITSIPTTLGKQPPLPEVNLRSRTSPLLPGTLSVTNPTPRHAFRYDMDDSSPLRSSPRIRTWEKPEPPGLSAVGKNLAIPAAMDHLASDDTTSIYSVASAPLEAHDHLLSLPIISRLNHTNNVHPLKIPSKIPLVSSGAVRSPPSASCGEAPLRYPGDKFCRQACSGIEDDSQFQSTINPNESSFPPIEGHMHLPDPSSFKRPATEKYAHSPLLYRQISSPPLPSPYSPPSQ
ncbi:hypothetical protein B0H34DRAFT_354453 [Crassisporium funariophilum]|nr:hypothetical protein B0H34DRAFT_354453 [Crassisporium funariophilum]